MLDIYSFHHSSHYFVRWPLALGKSIVSPDGKLTLKFVTWICPNSEARYTQGEVATGSGWHLS